MNYNDKRKRARQQVFRHRIYEITKLQRFLRNRYSYEFVDDDQRKKFESLLPFRYMEKQVSIYGRAAIYQHPKYGIAIYKTTMAGNLNIYGLPATYFLYTYSGGNPIKVAADDPNLIILQDNFDGSSLDALAQHYGEQLGKIRETIITNTFTMRTPFIISAPKEKLLEVRMIMEAINEAPDVLADPNLEMTEAIKVFKTDTPDRLKSLEDEYNTTFGKFKEEIGFSANQVDKKERLVAEEAEQDEDMLKAFDNEPYENRKKFIKHMEDKFEIKLKLVKANEDLYIETPVAPEPKKGEGK
jgi:hypothetical protein